MRLKSALIPLIFLCFCAVPLLAKLAAPPSKFAPLLQGPSTIAGTRRPSTLDDVRYSQDVPQPIPDLGTAESTLDVTSSETVTDVNLWVNIDHDWVRDLRITLFAPGDETGVVVLDLLPHSYVDSLEGWFDDEAAVGIMQADTPFYGHTWRPLHLLSALDGMPAGGQWRLRVEDQIRADSGSLAGWGLELNSLVRLRGVVTNSYSGQPVRNALVELVRDDTLLVISGSTSGLGVYEFSRVDTGLLTLRFSKAFYDTLSIPGISIPAGDSLRVDTVMNMRPRHFEFYSVADSVYIPDDSSIAYSLRVRGAPDIRIDTIAVTVDIRHSYDADLSMWIVSPLDSQVLLATGVGAAGDNFSGCTFDDRATTDVEDGAAPFSGSYRPTQPLRRLRGQMAVGSWTLFVADSAARDSGFIDGVLLHIIGDTVSVSVPPAPELAGDFHFYGNYPNPFNGRTEFRFDLAAPARSRLILYNLIGQEVAVLTDAFLQAGSHRVFFDARDLASGLYFARLTVGQGSISRKVLLLR